MSNSIAFQGNLTNDPEVKQHDGKSFTSFSIAENFGKEKDQVHYFRCSAGGKQGELIASSCKKGHKLTVLSGQLKASLYTNPQGQSSVQLNVYVNSFAFCEPFNAQEHQQAAPPAQNRPPQPGYAQPPQQQYAQPPQGYTAPPAAPVPQYTTDPQGNQYQLVNGAWQMIRPAAAPDPQQPAPWGQPQQPAPQGQQHTYANPELPFNAPPGNRPF